jgi:osmotically-inducible protein OsmY
MRKMGTSSDICAAVIDDLTLDPDVDASDIRVAEMNGDVVLTASVPSYPQYVQATAVAARTARVRCVRNHLQMALPPGDHVRTGTEREAAEVMVAELTGVRRVRHDIQIRDLEQA